MLTHLCLFPDVITQDRQFLSQHYYLDEQADWQLSFRDNIYFLKNKALKLSMDLEFSAGKYLFRKKHPAKEPLANAVKIKKKLPQTLIDATPGVLKDSLMLASRGVAITAIERNPLLYIMVRQSLSQLNLISINYVFGNAIELLDHYRAEVIYLDPMYPDKKKKAQVKKDMQLLHHIIGKDQDADQLFYAAKKQAARVIVKRPSCAPPLANQPPSFVSKTGTTRFDVYLPTKN